MKEKFHATLLGLAIGDAMGGPLEFMSTNQIQIRHGTVTSMIGGGWLHLRPGQYTGDSVLMMAMAESLIEYRQLDKKDLIARYLKWYHGNPQDIGQVMRTTLALLKEGEEIGTAANKADGEFSGDTNESSPLPLCVPLALLHYESCEALIENTAKATKLTHCDKKVISAAVALNLVIARILNGESEYEKILTQAGQLLDANKLGLYNVLPDIAAKKERQLRTSCRIEDTLETALWAVFKKKNFRDAIVSVINLGGDAGAIGAVTGALAGALYGLESIPLSWRKSLEDKNIFSSLATGLFKLAEHA